ncbi:MAG: phenylalanine--tRNA ligase subunit beta [Verrucomicrobiae bacterium]|nr:phenylalanine--tRNA ligase subunit beta [Verrucomicrobiae bacterium]
MRFSLNWLKEFVSVPWTAAEVGERLTMSGIEVEGIYPQGQDFDRVTVAQILKSEKHPNADRLSVCEVETGAGKAQIVCGAKNYQVGDKVPLAQPGARLPNGLEIARTKLRGVESAGMLCSPKELGLAEDAQGLMILPPDAPVGKPFAEYLGLNDTLLELEITPNRPDLLSHWGMARELAAVAGIPPPDPRRLLSADRERALLDPGSSKTAFSVRVEDVVRCPRYTARVLRGVRIGPSPEGLRRRLERLGQRAISNVVDITNYVLLEIGQPLHAFDLDLLRGPEIVVRGAREGEKILRLDGFESALKPDMLVIADRERPVALAGVIGGSETAVGERTVNLLLESAAFQPASIRRTSKALGVSTDSSYRFERGVDPELAGWASLRAAALILDFCGGRAEGPLVDARAPAPARARIPCRHARVARVAGKPIPAEETVSALQRLGCQIAENDATACRVTPPSWRPDLEREADLIEETIRLHGIGNISGRLAPVPLSSARESVEFAFAGKIRDALIALGLDEAITTTVMATVRARELHPDRILDTLTLANPLSAEMDCLRPSLLHGLLETAARNFAGGAPGLAIFEIGQVFEEAGGKAAERAALGLLLAGTRPAPATWEEGGKPRAWDDHDLRGIVEELAAVLRIPGGFCTDMDAPLPAHLELGAALKSADGASRGGFGRVAARALTTLKISPPVFFAEIEIAPPHGETTHPPRYRAWPAFPAVRRDLALIVPAAIRHATVAAKILDIARRHANPKGIALEDLTLFDVFASEKLGAGKKSLAYSMAYRSPERTLKDLEVHQIHAKLTADLKAELGAELRE